MTEHKQPLLKVDNLSTSFYTRDGVVQAVKNMSYDISAGETLAIVGESGSGKSVSCYSLLNLIPQPPGKIESGSALFDGTDLLQCSEKDLLKIRGNRIAMIFQDPMTSLNPYLCIGDQLIEGLLCHSRVNKKTALARAEQALTEVGIDNAAQRLQQFPHEFSGGMQQRVMIAIALMTEPELLIADEPTTALDVTIQAQIFELLQSLQERYKLAIIFITHDLSVVARLADQVLVMQNGEVVEKGSTEDIFLRTQHDYTRKLLDAIPNSGKPDQYRFTDDHDAESLLKVTALKTSYRLNHDNWFQAAAKVTAVDEVDLHLKRGEILGLVGESGCGKSSLSKTIMQLIKADSGSIVYAGRELTNLGKAEMKSLRKEIQIIFQDPYASLNPRMSVYDTLLEPLKLHGLAQDNVDQRIAELLQEVGLSAQDIRKYPHEFSGGQHQRIAIARALAVEPKLIIADEPVSALDVTVQAQVLKLLLELVRKRQLSMIFVSHDLSVIRYICDRTAVMNEGRIVEVNSTEEVFNHPQHAYTQKLLAAIPSSPLLYSC